MSTTFTGSHTLTALFDSRADAMRVVGDLVGAGIARTAVRVTPETDAAPVASTASAYDTAADDKGFWASLKDLFVPDEDRSTYAEAMHRGDILVSVVAEGADAELAEEILEQHGTVNVDEREASLRGSGGAGSGGAGANRGETDAIPEVEEQLRVGKRQVNSGRVKVRSYVVETPVSEEVNLHSETVRVERRPVDRALDVTEDEFRERTIEAVATSEEAVVSKEARVTGEVLVRKDAANETRTIEDKVRSTKVVVENEAFGTNVAGPNSRH